MKDNTESAALVDRRLGPLTVLFGEHTGKYPQGNSLLVQGRKETVLIDPSLGIVPRASRLPRIDRLLFSHAHEDHIAGAHLFPDIPWHVHKADLLGVQSLDGLLEIYGLPPPAAASFSRVLLEQFHYQPKAAAVGFGDGDRFDLGGVLVEVVHTPGHTRGHSCFLIQWEGSRERFLYLGDIDLTGFGPYYGDAWSSLADFEASIERIAGVPADYWLTFHHKGLLDSHATFVTELTRFAAMIGDREGRLLDYLSEPRGIDEIVAHRFIYRPGNQGVFIDSVERFSMQQHLARLILRGQVLQHGDGRFQRQSKE